MFKGLSVNRGHGQIMLAGAIVLLVAAFLSYLSLAQSMSAALAVQDPVILKMATGAVKIQQSCMCSARA